MGVIYFRDGKTIVNCKCLKQNETDKKKTENIKTST